MISLKQIWEQLDISDDNDTEEWDFKPIKKIDYEVPPFTIPDTRKKEYVKEMFSKVLAFIDMEKYLRYTKGCTIIPIATTSKRLKSICGSTKQVSRFIQFMKEIGLIKDEDTSYQYNANNKNYNKSKTYQYFYDNELLVVDYCNKNNINRYIIKNSRKCNIDTVVDTFTIDNFPIESVRFNSKLHLLKPDNWSVSYFEDYLTDCLYHNYPELIHYQQLADRINEFYYFNNVELQIRYVPNFTWTKGNTAVRKIGIRATNSLCSVKKEDRKELLAKYNLNLEKDVRSSIPRLSLSLYSRTWIKETVDVYELIYNRYIDIVDNSSNGSSIDTVVDTFTDMRELIKNMTLSAWFDYTDDRYGAHVRSRMKSKFNKDEVYETLRMFQTAVKDVTAHSDFDSEIFYHESNIYMNVLIRLLEDGFKVWQVYDSWYARKDGVSQEEYEELVTNIVENEANAYFKRL